MTPQSETPLLVKRPSIGARRPSSSQQQQQQHHHHHMPPSSPSSADSNTHNHHQQQHQEQVQQHSHHQKHKFPRHVVGRRSTSFGKNLNKLSRQQDADAATAAAAAAIASTPQRHSIHPRSLSSGSTTAGGASARVVTSTGTAVGDTSDLPAPPTSPTRPSHAVRRNASAFVVPRTSSHSALKKNHSSGHLPRHPSGKNVMKAARHQPPPNRRSKSQRSDASQGSPQQIHPTVRFNLGDDQDHGDENEDDGWTEDSTSLSPNTTRDHTRQNSVIIDSGVHRAKGGGGGGGGGGQHTSTTLSTSTSQTPSQSATTSQSQRSLSSQTNGSSASLHHLNADAITSRLLMRGPSLNSTQISNISATAAAAAAAAVATTSQPQNLSNSQGSTLNEYTPSGSGGRDLVSRFINGGSSGGTPAESSGRTALTTHSRQQEEARRAAGRMADSSEGMADDAPSQRPIETHRRNRSTPSASAARSVPSTTQAKAHQHPPPTAFLPPSRTQQKLELQRASSALEPAKHIPPGLPHPSAPRLLSSGVHGFGFGAVEGGYMPAQMQNLFSQVGKEYAVVGRYRRPVADALVRLERIGALEKGKTRSNAAAATAGNAHNNTSQSHQQHRAKRDRHGSSSSSQQQNNHHHPNHHSDRSPTEHGSLHVRKSRVSFEVPGNSAHGADDDDDDHDHDGSNSSDTQPRPGSRRDQDEVLEICRRMWELGGNASVVG